MEKSKKAIIIIFILVLAVVGFFVYKFIKNKQTITVTTPSTSTSSINTVKEKEFNEALKNISATDQDFDGVPDAEEQKYKTDPLSSDTDNDGLNDWQEIFIYKTDPLKADTDGDTHLDGYEVRRGFDPNGTGVLR